MGMQYLGNSRRRLSEDGAYHLRRRDGHWVVELTYRVGHREVALLSTLDHADLADQVLEGQINMRGVGGGRFLINEFGHVLIRNEGDCNCYGTYDDFLEFRFDGDLISPRAPMELRPGGPWSGPGVGIRYTLDAYGTDIRYEPDDGYPINLSDFVGRRRADDLASRLNQVRPGGGNLCINQAREFFAVPLHGRPPYIYMGRLAEDDPWFPEPSIG